MKEKKDHNKEDLRQKIDKLIRDKKEENHALKNLFDKILLQSKSKNKSKQ